MVHEFKVWPEFFDKLGPEDKTFEVRKIRENERVKAFISELVLNEYSPKTGFTGRYKTADVGYVLNLSEVPGLGNAQGADTSEAISNYEVYGLYNISEVQHRD